MQPIHLIQSDWGGKTHEAFGPLSLYGIPYEKITVKDRAQFRRIGNEAPKATATSLLLLGERFGNQLGKHLIRQVSPDGENFKVIWIGVDPGRDAGSRHRVHSDGSVGGEAFGQSTKRDGRHQ